MERIIKFEAAAGSGKTHQLTLEYLKRILLLFRDHPVTAGQETAERLLGRILAITFTNKAANEMKERILSKLKKFALRNHGLSLTEQDELMLSELSGTLNMSPAIISGLSHDITEIIISNYSDFNVKTIDSLMNSIIQVISPDLNLPPDFEIGLDSGELARERARQFMERICRSNWVFMEEVLENIKNSETLQGWNIDEKIINHIVSFYEMALSRVGSGEQDRQDVAGNLRHCRTDFKKKLKALLSVFQDGVEGGITSNHLNKRLVNEPLIAAIQEFIKDDKNLKKINPVISKRFFKIDDPSELLKKESPERYREKMFRSFTEAREKLSEFLFWVSLNRVSHFSRFLHDFVRFWEENRRKIFVNEFSKTIREKLVSWEESSLPYIYLKLSDRFRHFLFDEFQDTSELQFKALVPILEEVLTSDEQSSLFIVGDRKQAIYRWRGGDAELMNEKRLQQELEVLKFIAGREFTRPLDENWRSGAPIIEFNNRFWDRENLESMMTGLGCPDDLKADVRENFTNVKQKLPRDRSRLEGLVSIQVLWRESSDKRSKEDEIGLLYERCLTTIRLLEQKGYRGSDIAILTRSNAEGRDVVRFLSQWNIPTLSDESLYLCSSKIIGEIIAFFRFVNYPPDDLSFYTFVSGDIFQKEVERNLPGQIKELNEQFLKHSSDRLPLYVRFRERYPVAWKTLLEPFVKQSGFYPPFDIFQDMTHRFQLYENFPESSPFLMSFGSVLHELELQEINSLSSFLDEWKKNLDSDNPHAIDMTEDEKRIRVLTIHKAKGLEFPAVLLPLVNKAPGGDTQLLWHDGNFFHLSKDFARINPSLRDIYRREIKQRFIDELNLLYVAFTRARDALFVPLLAQPLSPASEQDPFKKFKDFSELIVNSPFIEKELSPGSQDGRAGGWVEYITGTLPERKDRFNVPDSVSEMLTPRSKVLPTPAWNQEFLVFSPSALFNDEERIALERGEAIHRILSQIYYLENRDEIVDALHPLVEAENLGREELERLEGFLKNEAVFPFFHGDMEVHNEIVVAGMIDGNMEYRRIDRLMVKEYDVLVIDYKTGSQIKDEYSIQVREYLDILKPLFPEKKIRGYLLFVDTMQVKEIIC